MFQENQIVTAGKSGIHTYNQDLRYWKLLSEGEVDSYLAINEGKDLYVTQDNNLVHVNGAKIISTKEIDGGPFIQLTISGTKILGLSQHGIIHNLTENKAISWRDERIDEDSVFYTGDSDGSTAFLLGEDGALVHDFINRRFSVIKKSELPPFLQNKDARILFVDGFWSVDSKSGEFVKFEFEGEYPKIKIGKDIRKHVNGPLTSISKTKDGIFSIDSNGIPIRTYFTKNNQSTNQFDGKIETQPYIGDPVEDVKFTSIASNNNIYHFSNGSRFWTYDLANRTWGKSRSGPSNERIINIELGDKIYVLTDLGNVYGRNEAYDSWELIVGGDIAQQNFQI